MFDLRDYPPTRRAAETLERDEYETLLWEEQQRMKASDAGLVSLGAAIEGGARYERELAEAQMEMQEFGGNPAGIAEIFGGNEHIAAPVVAALNGWARAVRVAGKAA